MSNEINWAALKAQNRVKDYNLPWTEAELQLLQSGASADDIRTGKVKPSKFKEVGGDKGPDTPTDSSPDLSSMKKDELLQQAKDLGVDVAPDATKAEIIEAITKATNQPE